MSFAPHAIPNAKAVLIEVDDVAAGIAIREGCGFRFVAVDPRFSLLDGSRFYRLHQAEQAARKLAETIER